jgi:ABC-type Fe3+ transport system substrate-binding protein
MSTLLSWMSDLARDTGLEEVRQGPAPSIPARDLDLLLYAPCPVKLVMKAELEKSAPGATLHVPMGCTSIDPYDPLRDETDPGELPGVIASIGFGDFWKRGFAERFVDAGVFEAARPERLNPLYEAAGLLDPRGAYTIYGVTPYLFMVDEKALAGLPAPRTWAELLHPRYTGKIVMCGDGDDMADAVVLNMYKDFGAEGVEKLAAQCCALMHSSTMAKVAGTPEARGAAIFVMPAFFAYSTKQPAHVRALWPEDGAAASPLYFLAKRSERERLAPVIRFLLEGFAGIPSAAWFAPQALPAGGSPLPPEARLKWVGWDFIRKTDINALRDEMNARFRSLHRTQAEARCAS